MSYKELKSGTDVRGIASDIGKKTVNLTDEAVYDITGAFIFWLCKKTGVAANNLKICVGHDSRITAQRIKTQVINAITAAGASALDCGLSSTPAMFMTTIDLNSDAAVQITASHHPCDRNGLKFFIPKGGLDSDDIGEIISLADEKTCVFGNAAGQVKKIDYMPTYAARLRKIICDAVGKAESEKPLSGYHIIVDAGNGAGGFYAKEVLLPLGADISGSQFLEPDGMFPNHIPNPEDGVAMESICNAVKASGADLGLIFDTDVDRAGCVDSSGNEINRNRLIALASFIAVQGNEGATIVTDSVTSDGLKTYINEHLKGNHYRYRRGYKNVISKAQELCAKGINCPLAIETSGHAAFRENYFLDDGAYLVTKIIIELAKGQDLNSILSSLAMPAFERECRFNIKADDFRAYGEQVLSKLQAFVEGNADYTVADDNREGLRVSYKDGWFLLRMSVHDPVMPMNFECNTVGGIDEMVDNLRPFFKQFELLDISSLK